jgi:hypothetical protein
MPDDEWRDERPQEWTLADVSAELRRSMADRRRLNKRVRYIEAACAALSVFLIVSMGLTTGVPGTALRGLIGQNRQRASEAKALAVEIQRQRAASLRLLCVQQNHKHDRTLRTLDRRLELRVKTASPERAQEIRASRASTVALIDSLAPRQDCGAFVRQQMRARRRSASPAPTPTK